MACEDKLSPQQSNRNIFSNMWPARTGGMAWSFYGTNTIKTEERIWERRNFDPPGENQESGADSQSGSKTSTVGGTLGGKKKRGEMWKC